MYGGTTYDCFAVNAVFWCDDEHAASEPADLLGILSFLKSSWHGAKNSCLSASSDESLHLGFTAKHLSTRLKKELGIISSKSGLRVLAAHHSLRSTEHNGNLTSKRSWKQRNLLWIIQQAIWRMSDLALRISIRMGTKIHSYAILLLPIVLHCLSASLFPWCSFYQTNATF